MKKKNLITTSIIIIIAIIAEILVYLYFSSDIYQNKIMESKLEEADVVVSFSLKNDENEEKKVLNKGEAIDIVFNVDKLPSNGYGICAFSLKFIYDTSQLKLMETTNEIGIECYWVIPGSVGKRFGLGIGCGATNIEYLNDEQEMYSISIAALNSGHITQTGEFFTIRFEVLQDIQLDLINAYVITDADDKDCVTFMGYDDNDELEEKKVEVINNL